MVLISQKLHSNKAAGMYKNIHNQYTMRAADVVKTIKLGRKISLIARLKLENNPVLPVNIYFEYSVHLKKKQENY